LLKKKEKKPGGESAPAPEKPSLSHFHYGNATELGAAGHFVKSLDSSGSASLRVSNRQTVCTDLNSPVTLTRQSTRSRQLQS
jgi:hypothetical protein